MYTVSWPGTERSKWPPEKITDIIISGLVAPRVLGDDEGDDSQQECPVRRARSEMDSRSAMLTVSYFKRRHVHQYLAGLPALLHGSSLKQSALLCCPPML